MLSLRLLPAGAAFGILLRRKNETKSALAKTDFEFVEDRFQTVDFYNAYKKIEVYGYDGCPYCAKERLQVNSRENRHVRLLYGQTLGCL